MRISRSRARRLLPIAAAALALLLAGCSDPQTTIDPKSDFTDSIHGVYVLVFWLSMFVFVAIMAITLGLALWYRERPGREARQIHGNTKLETLWTIIPVVIVVVMLVPTWQVIADTTAAPPADSMVVEAEGKQWWFEFRYPELGITTANELHLQEGRPVHVRLFAEDVIHSFWIPQLAGKVDMVPGHENDLWFTPYEAREEAYLGQCVEFCGTSHANMRFRVYVHDEAGFAAWAENEASLAREPVSDLGREGKDIFMRSACVGCHRINGTIAQIDIGPDLSHVASRETIASGILDNTIENLVAWIEEPAAIKPGIDPDDDSRFMPAFRGTLTPDEIRAVAQYLSELQ